MTAATVSKTHASRTHAPQTQHSSSHQSETESAAPFFDPVGGCTSTNITDILQTKSLSSPTSFFRPTLQRVPAFESSSDEAVTQPKLLQAKPLTTKPISAILTTPSVQAKCAECEAEERESEETSEAGPEVQKMPAFSSDGEDDNPTDPPATPQFKLTIGQPGDPYEREADAIADRIVSQSESTPTQSTDTNAPAPSSSAPTKVAQPTPINRAPLSNSVITNKAHPALSLQAKCACESDTLQTKADTSQPTASSDISSRLTNHSGSGQPIPDAPKAEMETSFGTDFSSVRLHTDSSAVQLSQDLGAKAFTHGSNIYFNQGQYNPGSRDGKHLLAHELTHTIQQGASTQPVQAKSLQAKSLQTNSLSQGDIIQKEEEYDGAKELAESRSSAKEAIDPIPAQQAAEAAEREGEAALKAAEAQVPETTPPPPEEVPESPNADQRVAVPAPGTPDKLKPSKAKRKGDVGQDLDDTSANICGNAAADAQQLADNESAHDSAADKRQQFEAAVEPPAQEGQSRTNAGQVETIDQTSAPSPDKEASRSQLDSAINANVPSDLDDLNNFKSEEKAAVMGNQVLAESQKQVGEIQGTYQEIENAPPAPPPEPPTPLPAIEQAPETPALNLGEGAVPDLKEEHTDVTEFTQQADDIYAKEGITGDLQTEIEKVQDGELGEANKERSSLDEKVANEPNKIKSFAKSEQAKVKSNLQKEESRAKKSMQDKRNQELNASATKQKTTKSLMEKKREEVTKTINGIYDKAKTKVDGKLKFLETKALISFKLGQARYAAKFERDANRDIDAWKSDRYSGLSGAWAWVKDQFKDVGNFPAVQRIFNRHREAFVKNIDRLIVEIDKQNQETIQECKQILADARKEIEKFVAGLEPELRKAGEDAQKETETKLADLDKHIDEEKKKLQQKLCDEKDAAIAAIDKKIEEMKEEMAGAVYKLGNLLLDGAIKFFKWALEKAGLSPGPLMKVINKGKSVIKKIVTDPIGFLGNLLKAVGGGMDLFVGNIKKHLLNGLVSWLTGSMGDLNIDIPSSFDAKGVLKLTLQILGLTYDNIRKRLAAKVGEEKVAAAEKGVEIIKRLKQDGPIALWNMLKEKAAEIKQKVMDGIRNWVITQVVKKAITDIALMLNPAGAVLKAILTIYDVVMFFVDNIERIMSFVKSIINSVANIANGAVGQASAFIEKALGRTVPIILSFLARLLKLNGIGKAVQRILEKIRKPIDKAIDKAILWLTSKLKSSAKKAAKAIKAVFKTSLKMSGVPHSISTVEKKGKYEIIFRSDPQTLLKVLDEALNVEQNGNARSDLTAIKAEAEKLNGLLNSGKKKMSNKKKKGIQDKLYELREIVYKFGVRHGRKELMSIVAGEFEVDTHTTLKRRNDNRGSQNYSGMSADHQPQDALMKHLAQIRYKDSDNNKRGFVFAGDQIKRYQSGNAICMNIHRERHDKLGTTNNEDGTLLKTLNDMGIRSRKSRDMFVKASTQEEAKTRVKIAMNNALAREHADIKRVYRGHDPSRHPPIFLPAGANSVMDAANKAVNKVKDKNRQKWPAVFQ